MVKRLLFILCIFIIYVKAKDEFQNEHYNTNEYEEFSFYNLIKWSCFKLFEDPRHFSDHLVQSRKDLKNNKIFNDENTFTDVPQTKQSKISKSLETSQIELEILLPNTLETFQIEEFKYKFYTLNLKDYRENFPLNENDFNNVFNYTLEVLSTALTGEYSFFFAYHTPPTFHSYYLSVLPSSVGVGYVFEVESSVDILYISVEGDFGDRMIQRYQIMDPAPAFLNLIVLPIYQIASSDSLPSFFSQNNWPHVELEVGIPFYSATNKYYPIFYSFTAIYSEGAVFQFALSTKKGTSSILISNTDPYPYEGGDLIYKETVGEDNRAMGVSNSFEISPKFTTYYIAIKSNILSAEQTLIIWISSSPNYNIDALLIAEKMMVFTYSSIPLNYKFYLPSTAQFKWLKLNVFVREKIQVYIKVGEVPTTENYTWKWSSSDYNNTNNNNNNNNNNTNYTNINLITNSNTLFKSEEIDGDWETIFIPSTDMQFSIGYYYVYIHHLLNGDEEIAKTNSLFFELDHWTPRKI